MRTGGVRAAVRVGDGAGLTFLQPCVVVAHGDALAGELTYSVLKPDGLGGYASRRTEMAPVDLVADEQDDAFASAPQLPLLDKEGLEIVGAEGLPPDAASVGHRRYAGDKLGVFDVALIAIGA